MERITDRPVLISFTAHEMAKTAIKMATSWSVVRVETKVFALSKNWKTLLFYKIPYRIEKVKYVA